MVFIAFFMPFYKAYFFACPHISYYELYKEFKKRFGFFTVRVKKCRK